MQSGQDSANVLVAATADAAAAQCQTSTRSWRRFLRFSVRGLIGFVLVAGCTFGWLAWVARSANVQRTAVATVYRAGGWVLYDTEWNKHQAATNWQPHWRRWIADYVGADYCATSSSSTCTTGERTPYWLRLAVSLASGSYIDRDPR